MANSRLASRASFFAEVDVLSAAEGMPQRLWGQNLSEAGIFLQTTKPFHPGDRLSLRFDVADNEVHVRAAEVVWVKPFEPINVDGALPGIGVRFLSVDPPARAAIRRYVHTATGPKHSDVPAPPPRDELPELPALESLKPLSLPPFDSISPLAALEEAMDEPRGDELGSAIHDAMTLPPDDAAIVRSLEPRSADVEHPLSGWRFELVREEPEDRMPPPDVARAQQQPKAVTLPPDSAFSLDEDGDVHDTLPPAAISLPPFELSGPASPPKKLNLSFEDSREPEERGPDVLALAAHQKVDQDFFDGKLSVLELPQAEERGLDAARTRKLRVAWAAGLLLAGGALGVVVGYQPAPEVAASERVSETSVALLPAPKPVAEAEKELLATAPSAPPPVADVAEAVARAAEQPAPTPVPEPAAVPSSSSTSVPFVSPDEIATSAAGKLPRKDDVSLTSSAAAPASANDEATSSSGVRVEYGRITLPLEGGRVARSFGLASPPRVVVDLVDAEMPRARSHDVGEKNVARVRFGRPDPVHVRVVVELESGELPKGITTLKKGSSLSVAWR